MNAVSIELRSIPVKVVGADFLIELDGQEIIIKDSMKFKKCMQADLRFKLRDGIPDLLPFHECKIQAFDKELYDMTIDVVGLCIRIIYHCDYKSQFMKLDDLYDFIMSHSDKYIRTVTDQRMLSSNFNVPKPRDYTSSVAFKHIYQRENMFLVQKVEYGDNSTNVNVSYIDPETNKMIVYHIPLADRYYGLAVQASTADKTIGVKIPTFVKDELAPSYIYTDPKKFTELIKEYEIPIELPKIVPSSSGVNVKAVSSDALVVTIDDENFIVKKRTLRRALKRDMSAVQISSDTAISNLKTILS